MLANSRRVAVAALFLGLFGCGESDSSSPGGSTGGVSGSSGASGSSGSSGSGGASGSGGNAGAAGASGGSAGAGGASGSAGAAGVGGGAGTPGWTKPACSSVKGTWAVRFTSDEGATLSPGDGALGGVAYTWGLAALDTPNVLIAEHAGKVLRSTDAGCSFKELGAAPASPTRLHAGEGGRAYGYSVNGSALYLVQGALIKLLKSPASSLVGLTTSKTDGAWLRVADNGGQLWDSKNEGSSFTKVGLPAPKKCFYTVAFDPNDMDHAVCGTITEGTFVTFDGGKSWTASEGDATYANMFSISVSPANANVVWTEGFQLGWHNGQQIGPEGRRIWRSTDGGKNFSVVVEAKKTTAKLVNGNLLAAHPTDEGVLYFTFGTPPVAGLSSESFLYRLDKSGSLTEKKTAGIDSFDAIVFSPAAPTTVYLGVSSERP